MSHDRIAQGRNVLKEQVHQITSLMLPSVPTSFLKII